MTSLSGVFTEKERTNWLKAWLAVGIAKTGLEQFADNEANTVHANIYKSAWASVQAPVLCIGCDTANLLKCPTPGMCNKRGANSTCTTAHASTQPRPCPVYVCNKVFDGIINEHRFSKPSWKNTSAKQWASNPWQIAKAYLPPDGYSEKNSVQDTDLNGIISFMVNCKHFDSKFSFDIAPDKTSPPSLLTEARDIGRSIRHSTTCKVTDTDLQKIFITLASLLSDQQCLAHHAAAQEAVRKLAKLQSDVLRITTEEMMKLLEAAQDKINTLGHIANAAIDEMRIYVENSRKELNTHMGNCIQKLDEHTEAGVLELTAQMTRVRDVIHSDIEAGRETISAQVEVAKREIIDFKATNDEDYYLRRKELLAMMLDHYNRTLSNVKTSPLNDWVQAKVDDIYMPPNLQLMVKDNGSFKKTDTPITQYSNVFFTDGKYNRNMFIQGEAGSGKSTFLAILVMDWCRINTTQPVERIQADEANTADSDVRMRCANFFEDSTTLKEYTFVFHVTLRDSVNEFKILEMIKTQIIDSIYGDKEDRKNAYKLLNDIMKRERCLVLLDGLDEWTCKEGHNLPELAVCHSQCYVLITTRPWKVTDAKIPDHKIDTLLQLEGVNEPFQVSKRLLGCRDDCKDSKDLDKTQSEFESYILENDLRKFLISPMLLQLIVQSWIEGTEMKGSMCEIYTLFLESLFKKANKETGEFQQPTFRCFTDTKYIQPNIKHVDCLAEAAFHLLFSNTRENSLVFNLTDLKQFNLNEGERKEVALKSDILSAIRKASTLRSSSSFSFIHKSVQEFFAAYYIARNSHVIDAIISGYLNSYKDAYADISQVFIFLCGLQISAANKLSSMMNDRGPVFWFRFPKIILSGYREAVANKQSESNLKLSRFHFKIQRSEAIKIRDLHNILTKNMSNVTHLQVDAVKSSTEKGESSSHIEFDLSSCSKLEQLWLFGNGIWLKDSSCSAKSVLPVWVVINRTDPVLILPCKAHIVLSDVTCSSTVLRSLISTLLTRDRLGMCMLSDCIITSRVEGSDTATTAEILSDFHYRLDISVTSKDSPGLWEALQSLNIESLSLSMMKSVQMAHEESLSRSLSSLTQLVKLTIYVNAWIVIQPPQSLRYLNVYCKAFLPSNLRELVDTLCVCTQTVVFRLQFGCCSYENFSLKCISPEEYIPIVQRLETMKNVAVKRFRIFDRIRENTPNNDENSCWSVRSISVVDDDIRNYDNFADFIDETFVKYDNEIINFISMRLQITPVSKSCVIN